MKYNLTMDRWQVLNKPPHIITATSWSNPLFAPAVAVIIWFVTDGRCYIFGHCLCFTWVVAVPAKLLMILAHRHCAPLREHVEANQIQTTGAFRNIYLEGPPSRGERTSDYITQIAVPVLNV